MAGKEYAVGIDLGTTYSCVAIWRNGKVEVIPNDQGNRIMPSCVSFHNGERLVGEGALHLAARNPTNTIFGVKRLIGRRYREESVQDDKNNWPFEVVEVDDVRPAIVVQHNGEKQHLYPEQISSMVLSKLKVCAETFLGLEVKKAVVTVPAYFNNSQRQATKDACQIAGLEVTHVLNEPTAAAMAYGLDSRDLYKGQGKRKVLIFDLGGGTLDVSLLELDQHGVVEVKATAGDTHLGGEDFDNRMVNHLAGIFQRKTNNDIRGNAKCMRRLKSECEKIKRQLSTMLHADIFLESFYNGEDFTNVTFTRAKFEELNRDLFDRCMLPLKCCLEDAKVDKSKVNEVVLVGGSTRIPKIQEMLKDFFNGKKLNLSINPDEAVACGAAIQAASLNKNGSDQKGPDVVLLDVTPLSLGLENYKGIVKNVIPRNTRIPCEVVRPWYTAHDNQTSVNFPVYEGERPIGKENNLLGKFKLEGLRKAPKGKVKFQVVFKIDRNGILKVSATNMDNQDKKSITITRDKMTLNKDEIDRMIRVSREFEALDKERVKAVQAKEKLKEYVSGIEKLMDRSSKVASKLSKESRSKVESALDKVKKWMEGNSAAAYYDYDMQKSVLESVWEPVRRELELAGVKNLKIN